MNKFIVLFTFLLCSHAAFSQSIYPYEEIKLEKPPDYKDAEPMVKNAEEFLLTTPFKKNDNDRNKAFLFLVKWCKGTREYDLSLHGVILEMKDDKEMMSLFIPAMVKFCLENKALAANTSVIEASAVKTVLDFSNDATKHFVLTKKVRKKLEGN